MKHVDLCPHDSVYSALISLGKKPISKTGVIWKEIRVDELIDLYWNQEKSLGDLARELGVSSETVRRVLHALGIGCRSAQEGARLWATRYTHNKEQSVCWDISIAAFVTGGLLGDAYIQIISNRGRFVLGTVNEKYARWFYKSLTEFGVLCYFYISQRSHCVVYTVATSLYQYFVQQRERWYGAGYKKVPEDLDSLSPLACLVWYIGDGTLQRRAQNSYCVYLHTCAFSTEDQEHLREVLQCLLGFKPRMWRKGKQYVLGFSKRSQIEEWFEYIGQYPQELGCYQHKWPVWAGGTC